jgi:thiamine pyrophosphate-dependent acetolactate synthase large subunit-like protein
MARPDRAVVAVMGDGGLQFTLPELACAAETGRQLTLIVYGWSRRSPQSLRRAHAP